MKSRAFPHELGRIARKIYRAFESPVSKRLAAMLDAGDWDGISQVSVDPRTYTSASAYFEAAAPAAFLKKYQPLPCSHDRRKNAIDKWWQAEFQCKRTNERLFKFLPDGAIFLDGTEEEKRLLEFFKQVRKKVSSWIGNRPPALLDARFGPGATYSVRGKDITVLRKISEHPTLTRGAVYSLFEWAGTSWGQHSLAVHGVPEVVRGNRFTTVPKTAVTDRSIASEPDINIFFQLGLGSAMRTRLAANTRVGCALTGWDIDRAADRHRLLAELASRTREFDTLDLTSASDTVSYNLVKLCFPSSWWDVLTMFRSPLTQVDGKWVLLEKFSSMGNGYTFELETILFAAIICTALEQCGQPHELGVDVCVFGDDIITRNQPGVFRLVKAVLEFCGLSLNREKTFTGDDPFRESCGADFFGGCDVRPFFLKDSVDEPSDSIALHNGIARVAKRAKALGLQAPHAARRAVLDYIPDPVRRCWGPSDLGDIVLHTDDESEWQVRIDPDNAQARQVRVWRPGRFRVAKFFRYHPEVVLACVVLGHGDSDHGGVIPRDSVRSYKLDWVACL